MMICQNSLLQRPATRRTPLDKFGKNERRRKEVVHKQRVRLLRKNGRRRFINQVGYDPLKMTIDWELYRRCKVNVND